MEIEPWGVRYVYFNDRTAYFIDVRPAIEYRAKHIAGTKNLPATGIIPGQKDKGEIRKAKNDGRLPYEDHNTRIICFGNSQKAARRVAQALAFEGFHNVSYFKGTFEEMEKILKP